ncbi:MAG: NADP-dependent glyceraldehyde-3-phosphate dehydrogenase [Saprospiraceae bacterium]|nr:NADP-dependent glyceraldehyde-3-phosphate dehydrogenase [Saprospiraceae bacterium]MDZ4706421.1 NADP-dependent glyceraldehyde-3-phosphate dehydrogenase [Saprospiraceae bacterium]
MTKELQAHFPAAADIPSEVRLSEPYHLSDYLVGGEIIRWKGEVQQVHSPIYVRIGEAFEPQHLGSYPLIGEKEALEALDAAVQAYNNGRGVWPTMSVEDRIRSMEAFTKMMVEQRSAVVKLLMWEIGKSLADSEKEFDRTVEYIYATIDELKNLDRSSSKFLIEQGIIGQVRRSPMGIVLCMGPFNYPLNETFTLLIPALIMGNVLMFKPPRQGILLHGLFQEAFRQCFPKGAINFLFGRGSVVIPPIMESGKVDVLTLIGSSRMADRLQKSHPKVNRLRSVLGLDAKNAAIVLENADLDIAVKEIVLGALSFNGQRCTAIKIVWAHRAIVDALVEQLSKAVAELKLGMPWDKGVQITPVAEPEKPAYLQEVIVDATRKGASVVNEGGGSQYASFVFPAIVYPIKPTMTLYREEQFGPVIPIAVFEDLEEPLQYLIDSDHGQQVSIFGTDANQIASLIDPLVNQVTRVNINAQCQRGPDTFPFSGRKDSAQGTLSVLDAIRSFSIRSVVATKDRADNKALLNTIVKEDLSNFLSTRFIF